MFRLDCDYTLFGEYNGYINSSSNRFFSNSNSECFNLLGEFSFMKVKNIDLINFLKGFFNLGSLREYLTDPENNKLMRHEISQYKDNIRHGCCEVYFPTDGENRKLENFFQLKNGKKHGLSLIHISEPTRRS